MPNVEGTLYIKSPTVFQQLWVYILSMVSPEMATSFLKSKILYRTSPNEAWKKLY